VCEKKSTLNFATECVSLFCGNWF